MSAVSERENGLEVVSELVRVSRTDWAYADLYLRRASTLLSPLCSAGQYEALKLRKRRVPRLVDELERAIGRGDWAAARKLAEDGIRAREDVQRDAALRQVGRAVYGARSLHPDPTALALTGALAHPAAALKSSLRILAKAFRDLSSADPEWGAFYADRAEHFEGLEVVSAEHRAAGIEPKKLKEQLQVAAEAADFVGALRLLDSVRERRIDRLGRVRARVPAPERIAPLSSPLPQRAIGLAAGLGFEASNLEARAELNEYLSCACADQVSLPPAPLTETDRTLHGCTCGHACPPGIGPTLHGALDHLMVHPFLTSAGTRYLPWFGDEAVLVETFAEGGESDGALLPELGLPGRRGLPRLAIEDALLRHGPRICEQLSLDPFEFRLVPIPFDVYLRLAPRGGWGRREMWTHFDGYQVTSDLNLRALVGGDARFGGAEDLCSVGRGYDSPRIAARFAIVRRARFGAREASA